MLVTKSIQRFEHPDEEGEWFDVELPMSVSDLQKLPPATTLAELKVQMLVHTLRAWSYAAPVSAETIGSLDVLTFNWLTNAAFDEEVKPAAIRLATSRGKRRAAR